MNPGAAARAALVMDADAGVMPRAAIVGGACLIWGYVLGWLVRHSYMPIMESN